MKHIINSGDLLYGIWLPGLLSVTEGSIRNPDLIGHINGHNPVVKRNLRYLIIVVKVVVEIGLADVLKGIVQLPSFD